MDETLSIVQEAFGAYDLDEDELGAVADALDAALGAAYQCALELYHPTFGVYADAGLSPAEAVDSVLAVTSDSNGRSASSSRPPYWPMACDWRLWPTTVWSWRDNR